MSDLSSTQPSNSVQPPKKRLQVLVTILVFLILLAAGIFSGYQTGLNDRKNAQVAILDDQLAEQFQQGIKAMESGLYQVALLNFQFILEHNANYPGAQDKLVEVLLHLSLSPTPYFIPTPEFTATPDLRGAELIFNQAHDLYIAEDWVGALEALDALRKVDLTFRTVEVDGMYYMALIMRGEAKIVNQDCTSINLEGGIYDLSLAERFGPLDNYAESLRTWARLYITGASFWEIDWNQAIYYFDQLYRNMPYMMDSSCMTSMQRYRYAAIKYADLLVSTGDICGAREYYESALQIANPDNDLVAPTATFVMDTCENTKKPRHTPVPAIVPTNTPTTNPSPTETPTLEPSPTG